MADQLQSNDTMMSANGIRPWHGIGTILEGMATAEEAIKAANLGWTVENRNTAWLDDNGDFGGIIPGEITNIRSDDKTVLGIVGEGYEILQNSDAFKFFDAIAEKGEAIYETAGSLFGGRQVFITAKIPGLVHVGTEDDVLENYMLLSNAHDGTGAVKIKLINTRVVCNNTLTMALNENGKEFSIRHTAKMQSRVDSAHLAMGLANKRMKQQEELFNAMFNHHISEADAKLYFERCFDNEPKKRKGMALALPAGAASVSAKNNQDDKTEEKKKNQRVIAQIGDLYREDPTQVGIVNTLWGAMNAVTNWTNHARTYKEHGASSNTREDNKLNSILWGQSADLGQRAMGLAAEMLKDGPSRRPVIVTGVDLAQEVNSDSEIDVIEEVVIVSEGENENAVDETADADVIKPAKAVKAKDSAKAKAPAKAKVDTPVKATTKKNSVNVKVKAKAEVDADANAKAVPVTA